MNAIIALYSRVYLTAALQEFPDDRFGHESVTLLADPELPEHVAKPGLLARATAWLRTEWEAIREAQQTDRGERIYWPPDL